jgi:hypothetical protein
MTLYERKKKGHILSASMINRPLRACVPTNATSHYFVMPLAWKLIDCFFKLFYERILLCIDELYLYPFVQIGNVFLL